LLLNFGERNSGMKTDEAKTLVVVVKLKDAKLRNQSATGWLQTVLNPLCVTQKPSGRGAQCNPSPFPRRVLHNFPNTHYDSPTMDACSRRASKPSIPTAILRSWSLSQSTTTPQFQANSFYNKCDALSCQAFTFHL
jgi:hypothetical protein